MAHLASRRTRALALPVGLALVASLGFLPAATATAAPTGAPATATPRTDGPKLSYVVNTGTGRAAVKQVEKAVEQAGGTVVISYEQIGVIVAHSQNPAFGETIRRVRGVASAGATRTNPIVPQATKDVGAIAQPLTEAQAAAAAAAATADEDPLEPLQWSLPAIKADKAHQKSLGSKRVTVAVIDTGVDDTHPDLAPNFDRAASVNCVTGAPDTTAGSWRPAAGESDHGTHVAGTIAAAKNGFGVTGVAPGVKVSGIKVSTPEGLFYTEAVVCGFLWAAERGVDVTNNSYYTDPWLFACKNDADQGALVESLTRAVKYAERKGTVNVAAAGNARHDLAARTIEDRTSPNDTEPVTRTIDPRVCPDIPTMLPGVVTVAATGAKGLKSSYSNYGKGVIDVAAPGGDSTVYQTPEPPAVNGLILSTLPGGKFGYKAGTSMASPHVAGVVALIKSRHPYAPPAAVKVLLGLQADAKACGEPYDYNGDGVIDAVCEGGKSYNGFYGAGVVDALDAVRW
ncbi:S8 family serine peptidase [Streptomyces bacillaris]|uniref:Peptidase S8 n=1 Tax=Streptomyces cavourensis TaxID=67258 RepID=A0AAD0VDN8_9ACTN|nr:MULTISPECIES: S8 family serine peptidase [Streptomyces]NUW24527.1 S8 family serine peptidase [Streptomyces roseoviolaceus]ALC30617.1 peptidase S8 [Streptomyces sp. CFMR 7]ATY95051.1 peptidase S8 [Streptomyces cavourensis]AXI70895.1 peptidase S8 [Streptomyces cavourensis]MBH0243802.1 S8 family serine peptidase [Streptomyces cavourensis]